MPLAAVLKPLVVVWASLNAIDDLSLVLRLLGRLAAVLLPGPGGTPAAHSLHTVYRAQVPLRVLTDGPGGAHASVDAAAAGVREGASGASAERQVAAS